MKRNLLLLLFALTLLFCAPILFTNGVLKNYGDIYQYVWPFRHYALESLESGTLPLWNPYIFAGAPFQASPQSALFYPLSLIFYFLPMPQAINLFAFIHLFLNAVGMFLLLKSWNRSQSACLLGAIVWSFSFFMLSKMSAGHIVHISGYSWAGLVILFTGKAFRKSASGQLNGLTQTFLCSSLVLTVTLQFFSGHTQVWMHTMILSAVIFTILFFRSEKNRKIPMLLLLISLGSAFLTASAVQFLPTFIFALHSTRHQPSDFLTPKTVYEIATSYSLPWDAWINLIIPDFFGNPILGTHRTQDFPSLYLETETVYFGIIPFLLTITGAIALCRKRKFILPLCAALMIYLAAGANSPLYNLIWKLFGFIRAPARFYFLVLVLFIFICTYFWDCLLKNRSSLAKLSLLIIVSGDLWLHGRKFIASEPYSLIMHRTEAFDRISQDLLQPAPIKGLRSYAPYRIFGDYLLPNQNKAMFFHLQNVNGYEAVMQKSFLWYFAASQGSSCLYTTGVDIKNPNRNSFTLFSVKDLILRHELAEVDWPEMKIGSGLKILQNSNPFYPIRAYFNLRSMIDNQKLLSRLNSPAYDPGLEIMAVDPELGYGYLFNHASFDDLMQGKVKTMPSQKVTLTKFTRKNAQSIRFLWECAQKASFWNFVSEAYYPGWFVWTEDGQCRTPFCANGYFLSVFMENVNPPKSQVYWIFRPIDFLLGAGISAMACLFILSNLWKALRLKFAPKSSSFLY